MSQSPAEFLYEMVRVGWQMGDLTATRRSQYEEDIVFNEVPESHHIVMRTVSLKGACGIVACARQGLRGPCKVAHQGGHG